MTENITYPHTRVVIKAFIYYQPKRSFGQGNIFTRVCDSVHREGCVCQGGLPGGCLPGGVLPGGVFLGGGCQGVAARGVSASGVSARGVSFWGILQIFGGSSKFSGGSPPEYGQHSAGTHPTGMHSCSILFLFSGDETFYWRVTGALFWVKNIKVSFEIGHPHLHLKPSLYVQEGSGVPNL